MTNNIYDKIEANDAAIKFKNKITLDNITKDFTTASTLHSSIVNRVQGYEDLRDITGSEAIKKRKGRSAVSVRLVKKLAEWRYANLSEALSTTKDLFTVEPKTWESLDSARQNSILLNHQFNTQINKQKFIDDLVRAYTNDGFAIIRVGWERKTSKVKRDVPIYKFYQVDPEEHFEQVETVSNAITLYQNSPKEFEKLPDNIQESVLYTLKNGQSTNLDGTPSIFFATEIRKDKKLVEILEKNAPTVQLVDPVNFYIDPDCKGDIDKAMYVVYKYNSTLSDLKQKKGYVNLDLLDENSPVYSFQDAYTDNLNDQADGLNRKRFVVYEYWGMWDTEGDGNLVPILVTVVSNIIIGCSVNPFPDNKFPFETCAYMPEKNSVFGFSDAELIGDNQRIAGALTRSNIDIIGRTANGQRAISKGSLDYINKQKFEAGEDFEINNMNGNQGVETIKSPEVPQSLFVMLQQQTNDAESTTGIKSFGEGLSSASYGNVAAGIKNTVNATVTRESSIFRRLKNTLSRIGSRIISMNQSFLSDTEVVRITNESNNVISLPENFITIYRDRLSGYFDVSVDIQTKGEKLERRQELTFILQTLGNTIPFDITKILLAVYTDLADLPYVSKLIREFEQPQDPLADLKLQREKAEIQKIMAEAQVKEAQAKYWLSAASKGQLDVVETETGTKHARDVEKISAQAESQAKLAERQTQLDVIRHDLENKQRNPIETNSELDLLAPSPSILFDDAPTN